LGRRPTKAAENPFCKARIEAAEWNEKLYSKEYAAEQLGVSVSTLSDYELGITKCIPPDNILRMSALYNAPEIRNLYCREMCPLGCDTPKLELEDLDRITVRTLSALSRLATSKEELLDIAADGIVSEDERPTLEKVLRNLEDVAQVAQSLKVWAEKNLR